MGESGWRKEGNRASEGRVCEERRKMEPLGGGRVSGKKKEIEPVVGEWVEKRR